MAASRSLIALAIVAVTMSALQAQRPASAPLAYEGVIVGRVIDGTTGEPVIGASVVLDSDGRRLDPSRALVPPPLWLTDREGRFAFRGVASGTYSLQVFKQGYLEGAPAQTRSLTVNERDPLGNVTVRIFRYATISGTVVDERGEPIVDALVELYVGSHVNGVRLHTSLRNVRTNDLGQYRIVGIRPGEYLVAVRHVISPETDGLDTSEASLPLSNRPPVEMNSGAAQRIGSRAIAQLTRYYPSAWTSAQARRITVSAGEDRSDIDVVLRLEPTSTISGIVTGPDGPAAGFVLKLVPSEGGDSVTDPSAGEAVTDANGAFQFSRVPSGQYVIRTVRLARSLMPQPRLSVSGPVESAVGSDRTLWARLQLTVGDADVTGLSIALREGSDITGRVEFIGDSERPTPAELTRAGILLVPLTADLHIDLQSPLRGDTFGAPVSPMLAPPSARLDANGRFTLAQALPGQYRVGPLNISGRWSIKAARLHGADILDEPLTVGEENLGDVVITLTDRQASVRFTVGAPPNTSAGSTDQATRQAAILVLPSEPALASGAFNARRMRMVPTTVHGGSTGFTIPGGEYYAIAIAADDARDWQDPKVREELARSAMRFSIADGEDRTIELTLSNVRPARDRQ